MANQHCIDVDPNTFEGIKSGRLRVVALLNEPPHQDIKRNHIVCFRDTQNNDKVCVRIAKRTTARSFEELLGKVSGTELGFEPNMSTEAMVDKMLLHHSRAEEETFEVVGLHIELSL